MVIDDSIIRSGLKVARTMGLGGLASEVAESGPQREVDTGKKDISDWMTLTGDGSVRRLSLDVAQINESFVSQGDKRAVDRPEKARKPTLSSTSISLLQMYLQSACRCWAKQNMPT